MSEGCADRAWLAIARLGRCRWATISQAPRAELRSGVAVRYARCGAASGVPASAEPTEARRILAPFFRARNSSGAPTDQR